LTHTAELAGKARRGASALLVCLSAAAVLAAGCETSSSVTAGPDPVKCQVSLAAPPMIDAGGGTGTLTVTTNPECAWTATSGAPWISLSPSSGQGSASVELRVAPNDGGAQRDGNVTVNGEQLRVSQRAPCRFEIAPATHSMAAAGGSGRITVSTSSDCAWTATTDVGWISLAAPVSGSGTRVVTFVIEANYAIERTGRIVIAGQRSTVTQAAVDAPAPAPAPTPTPTPTPTPQPPEPSCTFAISSTSQSVGAGGSASSVAVSTQSGCKWAAASSAAWIAVTSGSSGTGNGSVAFTVGANVGPARTGSLTIAGRVFTVTQASGCTYALSKTEEQSRANEGSAAVNVSTTSVCAWTATSNTSWLIIRSGSSGVGSGQVTYYIGENPGGARVGYLTVAGLLFRVVQDGR
jgi:hypothetical protein